MSNYEVTLTNLEESAMQFVAADVNDWIQNAVHERARVAVEEIVQFAVQQYLAQGMSIPSTREDIVMGAYANGWIKTAADRNNDLTIL